MRNEKKRRLKERAPDAAPPADQNGIPPASRLSRKAPLLLVCWASVAILFFLVCEGLLRLFGYGYPTDFFLRREVNGRPVWTDNRDFGRRFFPSGLVRHPATLTFPVVKPPGTTRIFVLGESAAMGDPAPRFGLPRMLEVLLQERFPARQIEVVNAAMVAINSHAILPIAQECAGLDADLWVVYMGNNEMVGPFGSISVFGAQAPPKPVIRASLALKRTRFGQFLDGMVGSLRHSDSQPEVWGGMAMMAEQRLTPDSAARTRVYENFRSNLEGILGAAQGAGVSVLLSTVAVNLVDCPPFASLHRADLTESGLTKWRSAYQEGVNHETEGNFAAALAAYGRAAEIDSEFADLAFRRARCRVCLGETEEAQELFVHARDADALPFRADSAINDMIREAAERLAPERGRWIDATALFAGQSSNGAPGAEFFYEHVHFRPTGNYLLARALAETVAEQLALADDAGPSEAPRSGNVRPENAAAVTSRAPERDRSQQGGWLSQEECLRRLGYTEWHEFRIVEDILGRVRRPPFTHQIDHAQHVQALERALSELRLATKPAQVRRAVQQVAQAVELRPQDGYLRWSWAELLEVAGELDEAEEQWRKVIELQPHALLPRFNLAKLLDLMGRRDEAREGYAHCLQIDPDFDAAQKALERLL